VDSFFESVAVTKMVKVPTFYEVGLPVKDLSFGLYVSQVGT
jgi:hypothetical protein